MGTEQDIQNACKEWCGWRGVPCERYNAGQIKLEQRLIKLSPVGHTDLAGCLPPTGRAFYAEIKRPGKKSTPHQRAFQERMREAGALVFEAHSLDEFISFVEPHL